MKDRPWLPYCAPFFLYMGFLLLQSRLPADSLLYMYPVRAVAVSTGYNATVVLGADGSLYGFGANDLGQLGLTEADYA